MDWTKWIHRGAEPPRPPLTAAPEQEPISYVDQRAQELAILKHDLAVASRTLADEETHWAARRGDDPETFAARASAAPRVLGLRAEVQRLNVAVATLERDLTQTQIAVADYTVLTDAAAATTAPIVNRLPSDAELATAFRSSREIESLAAKLLAQTGDRQFRRPRSDPHRLIREALEDRVHQLTGLRLLRSSRSAEPKTGTGS